LKKFVFVLAALCLSSPLWPTHVSPNTEWVGNSLKEMESIKVGMKRADLAKVFTMEGGLSSRTHRTYFYRDCPYFKVDVRFKPVGDGSAPYRESLDDLIESISRPYIAWSTMD
jgi:hypothetical protein